jgi:SAM-dependent methyltransferase
MDADRAARIAAVGYRWKMEPQNLRHDCPFCGVATETHPHEAVEDRYGYHVGVTVCDVADAWYLDPYLDDVQVAEFYGQGWYRKLVSAYHGRDVMATLVKDQIIYAAWMGRIGLLRPFQEDEWYGRILEVGCSTGAIAGITAEVLEGVGSQWLTVGLDPAVGEGGRFECDIGIPATLESANGFSPPCFDLILCCQTLDHLREPRRGLERISRWLAPEGLLWVDILDVNEQFARLGDWQQVRKVDHPAGMCRASLDYLLCMTGYEVVRWVEAKEHCVPDHVGAIAKVKHG